MAPVAVRSAAQITGIAPQFLVDDLDRAIAYYCDRLGFELDFKYQSFYAGVRRDGFAIHLSMRRNWPLTEPTGNRTSIWTRTFPCPGSEACSASCKRVELK